MNGLVDHLDTLVGPRTPLHQKLYDIMLHVSVNYEIGDTITIDPFEIIVGMSIDSESDSIRLYDIIYNDIISTIFQTNVSSYLIRPVERYYKSLDCKCKEVICDYMTNIEPWEVN